MARPRGARGLVGLIMLFVAAAFALSLVIPGWLAALIVAVVLFLAAGLLARRGWSRRLRSPLEATRRTIREDVAWARRRFR